MKATTDQITATPGEALNKQDLATVRNALDTLTRPFRAFEHLQAGFAIIERYAGLTENHAQLEALVAARRAELDKLTAERDALPAQIDALRRTRSDIEAAIAEREKAADAEHASGMAERAAELATMDQKISAARDQLKSFVSSLTAA